MSEVPSEAPLWTEGICGDGVAAQRPKLTLEALDELLQDNGIYYVEEGAVTALFEICQLVLREFTA